MNRITNITCMLLASYSYKVTNQNVTELGISYTTQEIE